MPPADVVIHVDTRETPTHVGNIFEALVNIPGHNCKVAWKELESGDVQFWINEAQTHPTRKADMVIEIKWSMQDMFSTFFTDAVRGKRQVAGLCSFPRRVLLLCDRHNLLADRKYDSVDRRIRTLMTKYAIPVRILKSEAKLIDDIVSIIKSFARNKGKDEIFDYPLLDSPPKASPLFALLHAIPKIGPNKAYEIEKEFKTVIDITKIKPGDVSAKVKGVGKKIDLSIYDAIRKKFIYGNKASVK